ASPRLEGLLGRAREGPCAERRVASDQQGRVRRPHRSFRGGEDDAAAAPLPRRSPVRRRHRGVRLRAREAEASRRGGAPALGRRGLPGREAPPGPHRDRKSTRLNSSHLGISYAVFCLKKKKKKEESTTQEE